MKRTTIADIEQVLNVINNDMPKGYYLALSQSYGHKGVDLMRGEGYSIIKTMMNGYTSSEVYLWLNAYHDGMQMALGRV